VLPPLIVMADKWAGVTGTRRGSEGGVGASWEGGESGLSPHPTAYRVPAPSNTAFGSGLAWSL